jgi:hypothetical protein
MVEKPQPFKGNSLENAWIFRSAFMVFVQDWEREFGLFDQNGKPIWDINREQLASQKKLITSFLTYIQDEAAVWACPQLELLAKKKEVFNGRFSNCIEAFKLKFESIQANQEARAKLSKLTQSNKTFSARLAEFETWALRTG